MSKRPSRRRNIDTDFESISIFGCDSVYHTLGCTLGMGRGYLADDVFHDVRECEDCVDPTYELPMSKALKMGASLCDKCTNYGN